MRSVIATLFLKASTCTSSPPTQLCSIFDLSMSNSPLPQMKTKRSMDGAYDTPDCTNKRVSNDDASLDDEAQVVDFVLQRAAWGTRGSVSSAGSMRRVLMCGVSYYWQNESIPLEDLPECFNAIVHKYNITDYNSVLCNVYEHSRSKIAPHCDNTALLNPSNGTVVSLSLAVRVSDREKELSTMHFSDGSVVSLRHGTVVKFDAHVDARNNRKHHIPRTQHPRVSLTFRCLRK